MFRMRLVMMLLLSALSVAVHACPFCSTDTAKQIRASLLGQDFAFNLVITFIPFLIFFVIVYLIYHGGLPKRIKK